MYVWWNEETNGKKSRSISTPRDGTRGLIQAVSHSSVLLSHFFLEIQVTEEWRVQLDSYRWRLSQGIPVLRIEEKLSDACLSMLIFSCVCAAQFWCRFRRSCKVLQDYVEWCPLRVRRFKKNWTIDTGVKPLALESEKPSGVLTEICGWRPRTFFNHFLPAFSFLLQNQFLISFLTASW